MILQSLVIFIRRIAWEYEFLREIFPVSWVHIPLWGSFVAARAVLMLATGSKNRPVGDH